MPHPILTCHLVAPLSHPLSLYSHDALVAAGRAGGAAPYSSVLEQQALLHSLLPPPEPAPPTGPPSIAGYIAWPGSGGGGSGALALALGAGDASSAEMERTALERMRMSINNMSDFHMPLALSNGAWRCGAAGVGVGAGTELGDEVEEDELVDAEFDVADEAEAAVAAYWERQELLKRAHSGQLQGGAGGRPGLGVGMGNAAGGGGRRVERGQPLERRALLLLEQQESRGGAEPGSARAAEMLPADPFDQEGG